MNTAFAHACSVFMFLIAPALLAIRYFWPRILPRWGVLVLAGGLGGATFYLRDLLHRADMMEVAQRFGAFNPSALTFVDGMVEIQRGRMSDFIPGAIVELVYLLLLLVPYGIIRILRNRKRQTHA